MHKIFAIVALLLATELSAQMTINGVNLPAKSGNLVLNGGGVRKNLFFKVYTSGLYIESKSKDAAKIVKEEQPMAMRLQITSSVVSSDNMSESIREGFGKSMKGNTAPLKAQIDGFIGTFSKEAIKEGDVFELIYEPGTGVKAIKNGKLLNTTSGIEFKKALFGIWLGSDPVDADLKAGLLGS